MNDVYHQKKLLEFAAEHAQSTKTDAERAAASIDYNIMMGNLEDPEEANVDE